MNQPSKQDESWQGNEHISAALSLVDETNLSPIDLYNRINVSLISVTEKTPESSKEIAHVLQLVAIFAKKLGVLMNPAELNFIRLLKDARSKCKLSQLEFAKILKVRQQFLSLVENGECKRRHIQNIAESLDVEWERVTEEMVIEAIQRKMTQKDGE